MTITEVGKNKVKLACPACGHTEGWVVGLTSTEMRRQPCPNCNAGGAGK
ncbi:hypothetical protein [Telmatospirillum siberiense]|nr:hypothetical protein [Telmatospirillum siberiense]